MRDCSVCECPPDEVPQLWKDAEAGAAGDGTCLSRKQTGKLQLFSHIDETDRNDMAEIVVLPVITASAQHYSRLLAWRALPQTLSDMLCRVSDGSSISAAS